MYSPDPRYHPNQATARNQSGFSLMELLIVVAIIGMLAAFSLPAFNAIGQARGATEAAFLVSAAAELGRSEAVTRQTYVWMAIQGVTNNGNSALRVGLVYSKDGSTNTAAANIQAIGKAQLIDKAGLTNYSDLLTGMGLSGATNFSTAPSGIGFTIGQTVFANRPTVVFYPGGEASLLATPGPTSGFTPLIAIGIGQARGDAILPANASTVVIDGSTGISSIRRQ